MEAAHYDVHHAAYARNIGRLLHGHMVTVGPEHDERLITIDRIKDVTVGIDRAGIFVGITVYDTAGSIWTVYGDGTIEDVDHQAAGRHDINWSTLRTLDEAVV
jgi:hypothetical protein